MKLALVLVAFIEVIALIYLCYKDEAATNSEDAELVSFEFILLIIAIGITALVASAWFIFR